MPSIEQSWYQGASWLKLLRPFSGLASCYAYFKRKNYLQKKSAGDLWKSPVPLIVVGNISVGGTGKTPFTIALCEYLISKGKRPGIISRGYGSQSKDFPVDVTATTNVLISGDEPLLLASRTGCPVVIDPDRVSAAKHLVEHHQVDIIISDDGMQHYRLDRDIEIALVDGQRGFGNGRMLPEGPLRESPNRIKDVDFVVLNSPSDRFPRDWQAQDHMSSWMPLFETSEYVPMYIEAGDFVSLNEDTREVITGELVYAVSGIGNPKRFYDTLTHQGIKYQPKAFSDHHDFQMIDFVDMVDHRIVMTEKDAVKCKGYDLGNAVYLQVEAILPNGFFDKVFDKAFSDSV